MKLSEDEIDLKFFEINDDVWRHEFTADIDVAIMSCFKYV